MALLAAAQVKSPLQAARVNMRKQVNKNVKAVQQAVMNRRLHSIFCLCGLKVKHFKIVQVYITSENENGVC